MGYGDVHEQSRNTQKPTGTVAGENLFEYVVLNILYCLVLSGLVQNLTALRFVRWTDVSDMLHICISGVTHFRKRVITNPVIALH